MALAIIARSGSQLSFNYPRNIRFRCLKCALCCGDTTKKVRHVLLLKMEAERIAEAIGKPAEEFATKIEGHAPYTCEMRKTMREGKCIFLDDNRCTIYPLRPLICRFYPFELRITANGKHEFLRARECQGIGEGKTLTKNYFENLLQQIMVLEKTHGRFRKNQ